MVFSRSKSILRGFRLRSKRKDSRRFNSIVSRTLGLFGVESKTRIIKDDRHTFSLRIEVKGPLFGHQKNACCIYVELSRREKVLLSPLVVALDEPKYGIPPTRLDGMQLKEVAAEKVGTMITRNTARDLYDLWYVAEKLSASVTREIVESKLAFYGLHFSLKPFEQSVNRHREGWIKELKPLVFATLPAFDEAAQKIRRLLD
jgi:predicted nucleotidyltransferase component of viral defense system